MEIFETRPVQEIYLLKMYDREKPQGGVYELTMTAEDAYDVAYSFLNDKFNLTKEQVVKTLTIDRETDYVEIYNEEKIDWYSVWKGNPKDFDQCQYFFRIVRTNVVEIIKN